MSVRVPLRAGASSKTKAPLKRLNPWPGIRSSVPFSSSFRPLSEKVALNFMPAQPGPGIRASSPTLVSASKQRYCLRHFEALCCDSSRSWSWLGTAAACSKLERFSLLNCRHA